MLKFSDFNMIDSGGYRAFVAPFDKLFNSHVVCLGDDFNPAVREVFGAAFYSEMFGLILGKKAKVNALNSTGNQNFNFAYHSLILQQ
jgi:hypothetical protein